ncbi:hypothetical protein D1007_42187 [Hordeum vulgare]|nr:hypothetical protein D1007_42187 [Hordeum vulgare]
MMGESKLFPAASAFLAGVLLLLVVVAQLAGAQHISYFPDRPACPGQCGAPGQSYTRGCTYQDRCRH